MNRQSEAIEVNFEALPGPAYMYPSWVPPHSGNITVRTGTATVSSPRRAARESLAKAASLMRLGAIQACLPPLMRPNLRLLRRLGVIRDQALTDDPDCEALARCLAGAAASAGREVMFAFAPAGLWTANWATASPSADTTDGRVHVTPANRAAVLYRAIEANECYHVLRQVFFNPRHFVVHDPLPGAYELADEGAANHMRLSVRHGAKGLNVFVYGRTGYDVPDPEAYFLPRQTRSASEAIARLHGLDPDTTILLQQHPSSIRAGCFHNDLIATSHSDILLYHELAFSGGPTAVEPIHRAFSRASGGAPLRSIAISSDQVSLDEARCSCLFNSQIVTARDGRSVLVAPDACRHVPGVRRWLQGIEEGHNHLFQDVAYVRIPSSMRNGGGPACLRLRVVLTQDQIGAISQTILLDFTMLRELRRFVDLEYPDHLTESMFLEADFLRKCFETTRQLYALLGLVPDGP